MSNTTTNPVVTTKPESVVKTEVWTDLGSDRDVSEIDG